MSEGVSQWLALYSIKATCQMAKAEINEFPPKAQRQFQILLYKRIGNLNVTLKVLCVGMPWVAIEIAAVTQ